MIWVKKKSGTSIIARFGDNSDSMILKFLKFLNKLLAHFSRNSGAFESLSNCEASSATVIAENNGVLEEAFR